MTQKTKREKGVVGYVRVSTKEQADEGHGMGAQREAIVRECAARGLSLLGLYQDDGLSGGNREREGLETALRALEEGRGDVLMAKDLSRITRSIMDFQWLVDKATSEGWKITTLDAMVDMGTAAGRAMAGVMAVFAQWEREAIGERTRAGLAEAKRNGVRLGRPRLIDPATEAKIMELDATGMEPGDIARRLNELRIYRPNGGLWKHMMVARIVARNGPQENLL